jgi:hypothetical protein
MRRLLFENAGALCIARTARTDYELELKEIDRRAEKFETFADD